MTNTNKRAIPAMPATESTDKRTVNTKNVGSIKVSIRVADDVPENIRQQKINRIYDILKPRISLPDY